MEKVEGNIMREMNFDAVIIGGGVVGCAIARELVPL